MKYAVVIEQGETSYGPSVPDLPGCVAVAGARDEAERLIFEAIAEHVELLRAEGQAVPPPLTHVAVVDVN